jgi:hypothetical protein
MTNSQIRSAIVLAGIKPQSILLLDSGFMLPTAAWVHGVFAAALDTVLQSLGLSKWAQESWDCDKFSRFAWGYAGILWAKTTGIPEAGLAFGMVCYLRRNNEGGHCVNVFVHRDEAGNALVQFVEPQQQLGGRLQEVKLTPEEIASIWSIIF